MTINFSNEDVYTGSMVEGKIEGKGKLLKQGVSEYEGEFKNEEYHGAGTYKAGRFEFSGLFENGKPTVYPN